MLNHSDAFKHIIALTFSVTHFPIFSSPSTPLVSTFQSKHQHFNSCPGFTFYRSYSKTGMEFEMKFMIKFFFKVFVYK